jgi:hypothetical protein
MSEIIVGVSVKFREQTAIKLQEFFTKYGCNIKTRLGLHNVDKNACSPSGLIILQLYDADAILDTFINELNSIDGVTAKSLKFE